jgi:glycerol dehydrogenase-like iron-containing ADH family enzyme
VEPVGFSGYARHVLKSSHSAEEENMSQAARALTTKELVDALVERLHEAAQKAGHERKEIEALREALIAGHAKFGALGW